MAEELTLRVITPERMVVDTPASSVQIPATDGSMGIFPKHAAMVAALDSGVVTYNSNGKTHEVFVAGGFAEVRDNTLRILSPAGETGEGIDAARAKLAETRARERLSSNGSGGPTSKAALDTVRAHAALRRAIMRLKICSLLK